jgi:DNA anti-recombination protein RmuC
MYYEGVTQLRTLEDVLAWTFAQKGELVEVIVQDEYTHDVIVRLPDGWQVFDTT